MSSPMTRRSGSNHLVAVFPDRRAADEARQSLVHLGIAHGDVLIGDTDDHIASLRAEMRSAVADGLATVPFPTQRGVRGFFAVAAIATVVALLVAIPLAFIDMGGEYWMRYIFIAAFLAFLGTVISIVIGFGMGMNRPDEAMAAERGVTLQAPNTPEARADLQRRHPIRLDEVDDTGEPVGVIDSEGEGDGAERGGIRENLTTDDYSPPPGPNTADQ